jgi:hypothetical protein
VSDVLADPTLELHDSTGAIIQANDNWKDTQRAEIEATGIPPSNDVEAAMIARLNPGTYTAILKGAAGGVGNGLVEFYDLDTSLDSRLANISTRGLVQTDDDVMIGGIIVGGMEAGNVLIRAVGPSLRVSDPLDDPTVELHNESGEVIGSNDNWGDSQKDEIEATGIPPIDPKESVLLTTLSPGNYTAIVRGAHNSVGVALVEAYKLASP